MKLNKIGDLLMMSVGCLGLLTVGSNAAAAIINLNGTLVAQTSTPAPTGSGSASIVIDTLARTLVFQSTYEGLNNNVSAAHIHAQAVAGPYVFPTTGNWTVALNFSGSPSSTGLGAAPASTGPTTYTPAELSAGFVTAQGGDANIAFDNFVGFLTTGQAYYNLHTSLNTPTTGGGNPGGSLGTFFMTTVPEPSTCAMAIAGLAYGVLRRRRASR
jgi:hypothetical protein